MFLLVTFKFFSVAKVSERDWRMTFLPQFKACVDAGSWSLMCSYNRYILLFCTVMNTVLLIT